MQGIGNILGLLIFIPFFVKRVGERSESLLLTVLCLAAAIGEFANAFTWAVWQMLITNVLHAFYAA